MSSIPASSSPVELYFTCRHGPLIREAGRSRPVSLDAIARDHGQRAVDLMMEHPGQWIGIEPGPAPKSIKDEITAIQRHSAKIAQVRQEIEQMAQQPIGSPLLPDVHPGTPGSFTVRVEVRIVKDTPSAYLVELPDNTDPSRRRWLSRSMVGVGSMGSAYGRTVFHLPLWRYRQLREQL